MFHASTKQKGEGPLQMSLTLNFVSYTEFSCCIHNHLSNDLLMYLKDTVLGIDGKKR